MTAVDLGIRPSTASAIAKYHMTEMSYSGSARHGQRNAGQMIQMARVFTLFISISLALPWKALIF